MKKRNIKQQLYADNQAHKAKRKSIFKGVLSVFLVLFAITFCFTMINPTLEVISEVLGINLVSGGLVSAMALVPFANIDRGDRVDKVGQQIQYKVYVAHVSWVDFDNIPLPDEDLHTQGDIPLKAGYFWQYLEGKKNSVIPTLATEGDDALLFAKNIPVILEGLPNNTLKFIQNYSGEEFLVVFESCVTGKKYIGGSKCDGLTMTLEESGWLAEGTMASIIFTSTCPKTYYEYIGAVTTQTPVSVAPDATTIAFDNTNLTYQLQDNTGATNITSLTGVVAADNSKIVKILGSGGSNPATIDDDDDFILVAGATWTANAGSELTLEIFQDGGATWKFIERSRIQT